MPISKLFFSQAYNISGVCSVSVMSHLQLFSAYRRGWESVLKLAFLPVISQHLLCLWKQRKLRRPYPEQLRLCWFISSSRWSPWKSPLLFYRVKSPRCIVVEHGAENHLSHKCPNKDPSAKEIMLPLLLGAFCAEPVTLQRPVLPHQPNKWRALSSL